MALATHSNAAQQLRPSTMMPLTSLTERSQSNSASLSNNNPPLVRVTLTDADMLANDPRVDSPSPPEQQPLPPNAGYKRILALISIHRKLWRTRINGRLCILEYRLPAWIRRRIDSRRSSKWDGYDMTAWIPQSRAPPRTYWDGLADGHTLGQPNNDASHANFEYGNSAGSFMGAALSGQPRAPPNAFDEHYRAYSVAMLPRGGDRENVSYGGKVIMPPSSLARLTQLNFPDPWMFQLRNPANSAASTHAGVLEFIADEGCVYLPHWMMKTLKLSEGQPIRITGASLPKGKFVKLQAQETSFVEVSDPRAILEQALRNFTCLTQGDIIEICYNTIVFGFLVMETRTTSQNGPPSSRSATPSTVPGISVFETDLEVDFATPKGWKEPPRPTPKPVETMASRLGLDVGKSPSGKSTPAGSRPGSSMGTAGGLALDVDSSFEAFKGKGETLNGRKTKGKGIKSSGRKIAEVDPSSKIERTDKAKFITSDMLDTAASSASSAVQPLELEYGQLFFGYPVVPYTPPATPPTGNNNNKESTANTAAPSSSSGIGLSVLDSLRGGNTLSGRPTPRSSTPAPAPAPAPASVPDVVVSQPPAEGHNWGSGGQALGSASTSSSSARNATAKAKAKASTSGSGSKTASGAATSGEGEKKRRKKKAEVIEID